MKWKIIYIDYTRLKKIFVKYRLIIYTYLFVIPYYILLISFCVKFLSKIGPPFKELRVKLRCDRNVFDVIVTMK